MQIGLNDIDPQIARKVSVRLSAPLKEFLSPDIYWGSLFRIKHKRDPNEEERLAYEIRKRRQQQKIGRMFLALIVPACAGAAVGSALDGPGVQDFASVAGVTTWLAALTGCSWWVSRAKPQVELRRHVRLEEMRALFPLLVLTRAERVYCDTLQMLASIETNEEAERTMRETLRQLGELLQRSRLLNLRRKSLLPLLGSNVIAELQAEYGALGSRLDQTTDPVARQSLMQSLEMCAARLENAHALEQGLERLKVQQEAIVQTLASAQSALARMHLTPELVSEPQTALIAQEIAHHVAQMNRQTYAVEQAVQEVIELRAQ